MTERITPEQATLTPAIIAEIRSLDAQRDPECRWLMQTAEIRWRLERLAANCIIPALDALAAAEQRTTDAEQRAERLAAAMRNAEDAISRRSGDYALRILDAALTAPATQPDERAAAERAEVLDAAREVVREGDHAWREHAHDIRALGSHTQYYVLPAISRLRRMLDALDATDGAAKEGGRSIGDDGRVNSSSH